MAAVGLSDVDERQHHEDEGLKQNNQDMEKPPDQTCEDLTNASTSSPDGTEFESEAAEKRKQEEQQFTAYMLPKSRIPSETNLARYSMMFNKKLNAQRAG